MQLCFSCSEASIQRETQKKVARRATITVSFNDTWQSMLFQLDVQLNHVIDFMLDEI